MPDDEQGIGDEIEARFASIQQLDDTYRPIAEEVFRLGEEGSEESWIQAYGLLRDALTGGQPTAALWIITSEWLERVLRVVAPEGPPEKDTLIIGGWAGENGHRPTEQLSRIEWLIVGLFNARANDDPQNYLAILHTAADGSDEGVTLGEFLGRLLTACVGTIARYGGSAR